MIRPLFELPDCSRASNPGVYYPGITVWDAPSYFEWTQKTGGTTSVAGHRLEALGEGRARLTLTLDMRGFLIPIMLLFYRKLTNRYMNLEAEGMKRAAESA